MLVYTYPSKSFTARTSRFREHFDLDFGSNFDGEDGFGVNMLQTPSRSGIEVAALFLECLSLQDGGYADEGIVLEDEIGARIVEFERGCVLRYGGGGRGECDGNEIDVDAALYSTTPAILCSSASSITSISNQSYFVGNTYDSQEEDDDDDDERGNTTAYLGYLDSLGLFTWHPNVPHTACDIFLLDE